MDVCMVGWMDLSYICLFTMYVRLSNYFHFTYLYCAELSEAHVSRILLLLSYSCLCLCIVVEQNFISETILVFRCSVSGTKFSNIYIIAFCVAP